MSNGARVGLLVGAVAVLVLAFVLLAPGDDDEPETATPTVTAPVATTPQTTPDAAARTTTAPATAEPPQELQTIRVRDGRAAGGVQTINVKKGERARIEISSQDTSDEIHLHGYDEYANVAPGKPARFSFEADAEGIFEIELHGTGTQIGRLVVEP